MKNIIKLILLISFNVTVLEGEYISSTKNLLSVTPFNDIQKGYELRKVSALSQPNYSKVLLSIINEEASGFLGYHGDSKDFYIYQDIIRIVLEEIVKIPKVRKNFHFLAPPLDPDMTLHSKDELLALFMSDVFPEQTLQEATFPLNFSLYDNVFRLGHSAVENMYKNQSSKPLGYTGRLKKFFSRLGMAYPEIEHLFNIGRANLDSSNGGFLLQLFDTSNEPYAMAKKLAYPSYPNGFISENRTVDEVLLDEHFSPPYPHELRLLITTHETLNPNSALKIKRRGWNGTIENPGYESSLREAVRQLGFDKKKVSAYKKELLEEWK